MMNSFNENHAGKVGALWLKISVLYLLAGVSLGLMMGASMDFTLRPVHAHLNLLGWVTMALAGLIYTVYPDAGTSRLAKVHFWLNNISLPATMIALALVVKGNTAIGPVLGVAEVVAGIGIVVFAANVFLNVHGRR
jgi:hypothetical protein